MKNELSNMKFRILHLEDSVIKQSAIARAIKNVVLAEIDWVRDMESGIEKLTEAMNNDPPYDLAITDMQYPLSAGLPDDDETGDQFVEIVKNYYPNLPVVICSSLNRKNPDAYGCVWYNDIADWERQMSDMVKRLYEAKKKREIRENE